MSNSKQNKQSQELATKLWAIANDLRGNMDSAKFKDYILGIIFYRYLSERTEIYMDNLLKEDNLTYQEALKKPEMGQIVKEWSIEHLGYIIEPEFLFGNLINRIKSNLFSVEDMEKAISSLIASTIGQESEAAFDKLFDDMDLQDKDLGKEVSERTELLSKIMLNINDIDFNLSGAYVDVLGTAYMILIGLFASDAGKKGGEFFSPTCVCELVTKLACLGLNEVDEVCDPCAGSGSLLLQVQDQISSHNVTHFYAQEKNGTTYNLLRMNLLMHGVPYRKFTTFNDDTLKKDNFEDKKFQVQVSNPPYSAKHTLTKSYETDPRFSGAGVLAPKSRADYAFVEHIAYHMTEDGRAVILLPHGVLFRENTEYTIRKYLIKNLNCIDAIIGLPVKLFYGPSLSVICLVLKKDRTGNENNICIIDASKYYTKGKKQNILEEEDINRILHAYQKRKNIEKYCYVATLDEIANNNYNLNIPLYLSSDEDEEVINIHQTFIQKNECSKAIATIDNKINKTLNQLGINDFTEKAIEDLMAGQIRFKKSNGKAYKNWEEKYLKDIVEFDRGIGLSKDVVNQENGKNKCILYGHLYTEYDEVIDKIIYFTDEKENRKLSKKGDILMPGSDVTPKGLATASCINEEGVIIGGDINILRPKIDICSEFLSYCINYHKNMIYKIIVGTSVRHLHTKDMKNLKYSIPAEKEEQIKIANFLSLFNERIKVMEKEIDIYQNIKMGFTQNVFKN